MKMLSTGLLALTLAAPSGLLLAGPAPSSYAPSGEKHHVARSGHSHRSRETPGKGTHRKAMRDKRHARHASDIAA